ncbi:MAG TPA: BamA/TamA family outer membrane protein, partial [Reyranellaceae bacterium]|nr:BamA/TamA family outer membrane protein [Reyranellaceae bacterium]
QVSTGGGLRLGFPVTEFLSFGTRYNLVFDDISLDRSLFFRDIDADGDVECDPLRAGRYLCDELGKRTTSSIGYSLAFDNTDGIRPTRGQRMVVSQDFAGLGGSVRYLRTRADATKYRSLGGGFVVSGHLEGGYIHPLQKSPGPGRDAVRLTDRFFGPQMRGFDIRGIGPRIQRIPYTSDGELLTDEARVTDALGGRAYYMGRVELEIPVGSGIRSLGLRPSAFVDIGSVWALKKPLLTDIGIVCTPFATVPGGQLFLDPGEQCPGVGPAGQLPTDDYSRTPGFKEIYLGDTPSPRISVGVGVNWVSPFGPLRLDIAKAIVKQEGDDTKLFNFNVGTQF